MEVCTKMNNDIFDVKGIQKQENCNKNRKNTLEELQHMDMNCSKCCTLLNIVRIEYLTKMPIPYVIQQGLHREKREEAHKECYGNQPIFGEQKTNCK